MRRLVIWNVMAPDGYFAGESPQDTGFLETVRGDGPEAFSQERWGKATGAAADMMNDRSARE